MADTIASIKRLFQSDKYTDMTVKCGDEKFLLHRAVVCTRSPFFEKALAGPFKEAATNEIDLSTHEANHLMAMIKYLYTNNYEDGHQSQTEDLDSEDDSSQCDEHLNTGASKSGPPKSPRQNFSELWATILFNVKIYLLGDQFFIPGLKIAATEKIEVCLADAWKGPMSAEVVRFVWEETESTDREIRDVVHGTAFRYAQRFSESFNDEAFYKRSVIVFLGLLGEIPGEEIAPHQCPYPGCELSLVDDIACMVHTPCECPWPNCDQTFPQKNDCECHYNRIHLEMGE